MRQTDFLEWPGGRGRLAGMRFFARTSWLGRGGTALVAACLGVGCATMTQQPSMSAASILPQDLKPGDTAVVTVKIRDKFNVVKRVEGVVKEDRTITFTFADNGVAPDNAASDGIWTIQVDVPFNAPPGRFEFEVSGYDERGELVVVDDKRGESVPLASAVSLVIRYPEDAAPPAAPETAGAEAPSPAKP